MASLCPSPIPGGCIRLVVVVIRQLRASRSHSMPTNNWLDQCACKDLGLSDQRRSADIAEILRWLLHIGVKSTWDPPTTISLESLLTSVGICSGSVLPNRQCFTHDHC